MQLVHLSLQILKVPGHAQEVLKAVQSLRQPSAGAS